MSRVLKESTAFFEARAEELEGIRQFMLSALWELSLPPKDQSALWLALEESVSNVIRHAYLYGEGRLRITVRTANDYVEFSLYDRGRRLEIQEGDRLDLARLVETGRKGGLGLYLIEKIMDEVGYLSRGEENEFRMRKYRKSHGIPRLARFSVRTKVSLYGTLILLGLVLGAYFVAQRKVSQTITSNFERKLKDLSDGVASGAADGLFNQNDLALSNLGARTRQDHPELTSLVIADQEGKVWADPFGRLKLLSLYKAPAGVSSVLFGLPQRFEGVTDSSTAGEGGSPPGGAQYFINQRIYSGRMYLGTVQLSVATVGLLAELAQAQSYLVRICLAAFVFGAMAIWVLGAYLSRPFRRLVEGLRRVKEGETGVPVTGKDEFGQIARSVNEITAYFKKSQRELLEQEKLRRELELAQEVQRALLPAESPKLEGLQIATWYQSAREVGGDFFDFFPAGQGLLGMAVADVSGKGVPGALGMAMVRTALRLEARGETSPAEILCRVNRAAIEGIARNMFVTVFLALLDVGARRLCFSSAGHLPMIFYRAKERKGSCHNPPGLPIGLHLPEGVGFEKKLGTDDLVLEPGDFFMLFTDGIVEAADGGQKRYGLDRLIRLAEDFAGCSAEELLERLKTDLAAFAGERGWADDVTALVVKNSTVKAEDIKEPAAEGAGEKEADDRTLASGTQNQVRSITVPRES